MTKVKGTKVAFF